MKLWIQSYSKNNLWLDNKKAEPLNCFFMNAYIDKTKIVATIFASLSCSSGNF